MRREKSAALILLQLLEQAKGKALVSRQVLEVQFDALGLMQRTLDRALNRLEEKGIIVRIETADRGMFFALKRYADKDKFMVESTRQLGRRKRVRTRGEAMISVRPQLRRVSPEEMIEMYERIVEMDGSPITRKRQREAAVSHATAEIARLKAEVAHRKHKRQM